MAQKPTVVTNPRVAKLIELEVAGRIKPEHQQELDAYRAQGLAPARPKGQGNPVAKLNRDVDQASTIFQAVNDAKGRIGALSVGLGGSVFGNLPGSDGRALRGYIDTLKSNLTFDRLSEMRAASPTGAALGSISDAEGRLLGSTVASLDPELDADTLRANLDKVTEHYARYLDSLGYTEDQLKQANKGVNPLAAVRQGATTPPADTPPPAQSPATPLDPNGTGDIGFNVDAKDVSNLTDQQRTAWRSFIAQNPRASEAQVAAFGDLFGIKITNAKQIADGLAQGRAIGDPVEVQDQTVDQAAARTVDGSVSSSAIAGAVDAVPFAPQIGAVADTLGLTPGRPSAFNSDRSLSDTYAFNRDANDLALDKAQDAHPFAYGAGQAATLVAGALGGARAIPALGRVGAWTADGSLPTQVLKSAPLNAAYGAAYGAGRTPEDPLGGALNNAAAATAGSALGQGVTGVLGRAIAPTGGKLGALYSAGVRPTLGQRFASKGGVVGKAVNGLEEAAQSLPLLGYLPRGARQQARDEFETGGFNLALGEIGDKLPDGVKYGPEAHAYMQEAFHNGYDDVLPRMRAVADETYQGEVNNIAQEVASGALDDASAKRFQTIIDAKVTRRMQNGELSGDNLKSAVSDLNKRIRNIRSSPNGDRELASTLEDYVGAIKGAASRHSDQADVDLLSSLDRGYAKSVRLEDAAARAGEPGRFTPNQFDRAVQRTSGGTRSRAYLRGDALMQDYAEAGRSLMDVLPNSGTPERLMASQAMLGGPVLGGLGYASPAGAATAAALTLPYAPVIRDGVSRVLAPRKSASLNTLGSVLRRNAGLAAPAGAAALLPYGATNGQ